MQLLVNDEVISLEELIAVNSEPDVMPIIDEDIQQIEDLAIGEFTYCLYPTVIKRIS